MSMILNWQLPPQLVRVPELTFYHPVINTSATYVLIALLVTAGPLIQKALQRVSINHSGYVSIGLKLLARALLALLWVFCLYLLCITGFLVR